MALISRKRLVLITCCIGFVFGFCGLVIAQDRDGPSRGPITASDCKSAWQESSASKSCTSLLVDAESHPHPLVTTTDMCVVKAHCATTKEGEHDHFTDYHGGTQFVKNLKNCGGLLSRRCAEGTEI